MRPLHLFGKLIHYKLIVKCSCGNTQGFIPRKKGNLYAEITDKQVFRCNKCGKVNNVKKSLIKEADYGERAKDINKYG